MLFLQDSDEEYDYDAPTAATDVHHVKQSMPPPLADHTTATTAPHPSPAAAPPFPHSQVPQGTTTSGVATASAKQQQQQLSAEAQSWAPEKSSMTMMMHPANRQPPPPPSLPAPSAHDAQHQHQHHQYASGGPMMMSQSVPASFLQGIPLRQHPPACTVRVKNVPNADILSRNLCPCSRNDIVRELVRVAKCSDPTSIKENTRGPEFFVTFADLDESMKFHRFFEDENTVWIGGDGVLAIAANDNPEQRDNVLAYARQATNPTGTRPPQFKEGCVAVEFAKSESRSAGVPPAVPAGPPPPDKNAPVLHVVPSSAPRGQFPAPPPVQHHMAYAPQVSYEMPAPAYGAPPPPAFYAGGVRGGRAARGPTLRYATGAPSWNGYGQPLPPPPPHHVQYVTTAAPPSAYPPQQQVVYVHGPPPGTQVTYGAPPPGAVHVVHGMPPQGIMQHPHVTYGPPQYAQ